MTLVQEFVAYCEQNQLTTDEVMSAAFYVNHRKIEGRPVDPSDWQDLLDFVAPDVPPAACSLPQ
jgi:hypothetical protein